MLRQRQPEGLVLQRCYNSSCIVSDIIHKRKYLSRIICFIIYQCFIHFAHFLCKQEKIKRIRGPRVESASYQQGYPQVSWIERRIVDYAAEIVA